MNRHLVSIFLLFSLAGDTQEPKKVVPIDISRILSYNDFQRIKQFVLDKGLTMTYCNMYNDNPYYKFDGDIKLYLNPILQFESENELKDPDAYHTIVIRMWDKRDDYPFTYTHIVENKDMKKIYLSPYYDTKETMGLRKSAISKYIVNILKEIGQEKPVNQ